MDLDRRDACLLTLAAAGVTVFDPAIAQQPVGFDPVAFAKLRAGEIAREIANSPRDVSVPEPVRDTVFMTGLLLQAGLRAFLPVSQRQGVALAGAPAPTDRRIWSKLRKTFASCSNPARKRRRPRSSPPSRPSTLPGSNWNSRDTNRWPRRLRTGPRFNAPHCELALVDGRRPMPLRLVDWADAQQPMMSGTVGESLAIVRPFAAAGAPALPFMSATACYPVRLLCQWRDQRDPAGALIMQGRMMMYRSSTGALLLAAALFLTAGAARAAGDAKYPNWKGQWIVINPRYGGQAVKFDPTKAFGPAQQAPLTPEYQKIHEASMADQAKGGLGNYPTARCLPSGMPRIMSVGAQEYVITPETTLFWSAPTSAASSPTAATSPRQRRAELLRLFAGPLDRRGRRRPLRRTGGRNARPLQGPPRL